MTDIPTRLWLIAHAPPPPQSWLDAQASEARDRAKAQQHERIRSRRANPRTPAPPPDGPMPDRVTTEPAIPIDMDLDITWRMLWADRVLARSN